MKLRNNQNNFTLDIKRNVSESQPCHDPNTSDPVLQKVTFTDETDPWI